MRPHLLLDLSAPMMSFGAEQVGERGPTADLPGKSFVTGMLANALGWNRVDGEAHDRLQARIVMGAAALSGGRVVTDFQTAELAQDDAGWTTRGIPEGRNTTSSFRLDVDEFRRTGRQTKVMTHRRWRDSLADAHVIVALRLEDDDETPTLAEVEAALRKPARPLFLGRKPFIPMTRVLLGAVEARTVRGALWEALVDMTDEPGRVTAQWDVAEGGEGVVNRRNDLKSWAGGLHSGERTVLEGALA